MISQPLTVTDTPTACPASATIRATARALAGLATDSVDCVLATPPPWLAHRPAGETGAEPGQPNPDTTWRRHRLDVGSDRDLTGHYVDALRQVFAEVRRVLRVTGVAWLNLGEPSHSTTSYPSRACTTPALSGVPWRVALALRGEGWILRNAIIWCHNAIPARPAEQPRPARYHTLFLFAQQRRYAFDLGAIRGRAHHPRAPDARTCGSATRHAHRIDRVGSNPGDVWVLPPTPTAPADADADTGTGSGLPVDVAVRCIGAGCPPGGVVLDPFSDRAGTAAWAAEALGRGFIGRCRDTALGRVGEVDAPAGREGRVA